MQRGSDCSTEKRSGVHSRRVLLIGNSDGIGLETTKRLLATGYMVSGISRSASPVGHDAYTHIVHDVAATDYADILRRVTEAQGPFDICIYCAGIGEFFDATRIQADVRVFEVNLLGAVRTAEVLVPAMLASGGGHIVVLSSQAAQLLSPQAPSYSASKAALSSYFEGLGLALRHRRIYITNLRLGFVDTKMAKSSKRPFLMTPERAADVVLYALEKRPLRLTRPLRMAIALRISRWFRLVR